MNELIMHYEQPIILKVDKIINESDDTKTFMFNHELAYDTGQFIMVWLPGVDEKPFAVSYFGNDFFGFSVLARGKFTKHMHGMKVGDKVGIRRPFGKGFSIPDSIKTGNENACVIGGGCGMASLTTLIDKLIHNPNQEGYPQKQHPSFSQGVSKDFYSTSLHLQGESKDYSTTTSSPPSKGKSKDYSASPSSPPFEGESKDHSATPTSPPCARPNGFAGREGGERGEVIIINGASSKSKLLFPNRFKDMILFTEDGSAGKKGYPTDALEDLHKKHRFGIIYTCGPEIMMLKVYEFCKKNNIQCEASLERYMKCGIGICGQCVCDGQMVCKDGPVFNSQALDIMDDFGTYSLLKSGQKVSIKDYCEWREA
jgi:NAD(P)H-flavin reductase